MTYRFEVRGSIPVNLIDKPEISVSSLLSFMSPQEDAKTVAVHKITEAASTHCFQSDCSRAPSNVISIAQRPV